MRSKFIFILLLPILLVTACSNILPTTSHNSEIPDTELPNWINPTISSVVVTEKMITPTLKRQPLPSPYINDQKITPIITPTSMQKHSVCSPLELETISSLLEIVSDPYKPPPFGSDERHQGVDFSYYRHNNRTSIEGEGVLAVLAGSVTAAITDRLPYGNMIIIETPRSYLPDDLVSTIGIGTDESLYHLYAHLQNSPVVQIGDDITCGQLIGHVGMTGYNIYNPHLHLETRIGPSGVIFTGMAYYTTSASTQEMENYLRWRTGGEFHHFDPISIFTWFLHQ